MTPLSPKEKAKELFKDMYTIIFDIDNGASVKHDQARYDATKRAAIKVVDETIWEAIKYADNSQQFVSENVKYHQEVKQELEKL